MLHEILFSLWGCSTGVLKILEIDTVELDRYLHPGERVLLHQIISITEECNKIRTFIHNGIAANNTSQTVDENRCLKRGQYLYAFCDGLDQALEPFRADIIQLEDIILNDSYTPLAFVLCRVEKYVSLFSVLNSIIHEVTTQKLVGCKLLQCLHSHLHTGIPDVKRALEIIMHGVHTVFYKQLTSWLLYGHLEDTHREFFIQYTSNEEKIKGNNVKGDSEVYEGKINKKQEVDDMWDYNVNMDMLPSYIRPSLATKILTVGQTIIMFGNDPRHKRDFICEKAESSVWGGKEYDYFQKLQHLQKKVIFDVVEFERTIDELKECVTKLLWRVAVEEAKLMQQLTLIKDFFLMGRGDLFLEFIRLTTHILNKMPTSHTSRDINLAFQMALRKTQLNDENAMESFNFIIPVPTVERDNDDPEDTVDFSEKEREDPIEKRGWGLIILKYKIVWPLHLLFSPAALNDYNTLFRFLLRVKKTQINLWHLWSEYKHCKNIDTGIVRLRNKLIFIVDNLQYYLQVDVLESQYTILETSMKNTRNFEDVQRAHSIFLANVMSQTFLLGNASGRKNPVNKLITIFLRLCDDFILQAPMWEVSKLMVTEKEELNGLSEMLDSVMDWLTKTLNRVRTQPSGEHLAQLLLRLDFNRWFSKNVQ